MADVVPDNKYYSILRENQYKVLKFENCQIVQPTGNWRKKITSARVEECLIATELKKDIHFTFKNLKDQCDDKYPQLEKGFIENFLQSSPLATPPSSTKIGMEVLRTSWKW